MRRKTGNGITMIHPGKQGMRLEHAVPGRVRFRRLGMKSNPRLAAEFQEKLSATEGVAHVENNPTTGSVIVVSDIWTPEQE